MLILISDYYYSFFLIKNFFSIVILFYTDGGASYPLNVMNSFKRQSQEFIKKFSFYALSEESNPTTLYAIAQDFRSVGCIGEVKSNILPHQLVKEFPEILNSAFHKVI